MLVATAGVTGRRSPALAFANLGPSTGRNNTFIVLLFGAIGRVSVFADRTPGEIPSGDS
jgi:hypothetical protein